MDTAEEIIVGYDGSAEAVPAIRWAARQAAQRNCGLHLVHSSLWPAITHDLGPVPGVEGSGLRRAAEDILTEGVALAHDAIPGLAVKTTLFYGWPAENLRAVSTGAALLVVGTRGAGGFMGLLIGSVSMELAATADCPVAVIRAGEHPEGPVVVGVDFDDWELPLRHACNLATLAGTPLRVVHVRKEHWIPRHLQDAAISTQDQAEPRVQTLLDSAARSAHETIPGLDLHIRSPIGTSIPGTLLAESQDASIIVVGTKGHGLVRGTIGSTAHAVLHHATCPILIVRGHGTDMH
ncbi:universal stress protein [Arthrobacter sp. B2a2-09]|uniref:universal stress protein n=1 Tax=Arthrobacter sp. B2a2-09 TaxID=2952822 RepID=UPI0022CD727D|nr:universal stress protein [Arthrobacter sp. B2a2-09]MCZ9881754.1 universal stress protein [Arthrobacter sp. B2a2-09]